MDCPHRKEQAVTLINLISTGGGVGRSSVACALAQMLHRQGRAVVLIQSDPINLMAYQLGMGHAPLKGLVHALQGEADLQHFVCTGPDDLPFLPFGQIDEHALAALQPMGTTLTNRLVQQLQACTWSEDTVVIVDLPRWPSAWCPMWLGLSDLNLVLLAPDTNSMIGMGQLMPSLLQGRGASYFLMNRFDSSHVLHLDLWTLSKAKLGHRLLPFYLHQDQALPESVAAGVPLQDYAPASRLVDDIQKLANWIDLELP